MADRENVLHDIENAIEILEKIDEPTPWCDFIRTTIADALELLKAQEPRVMTLEELPDWDGAFMIEIRIKGATVWASWYTDYELLGETVCRMVDIGGEVDDRFKKLYGYEWRCWTSRPTDAQREAEPWET